MFSVSCCDLGIPGFLPWGRLEDLYSLCHRVKVIFCLTSRVHRTWYWNVWYINGELLYDVVLTFLKPPIHSLSFLLSSQSSLLIWSSIVVTAFTLSCHNCSVYSLPLFPFLITFCHPFSILFQATSDDPPFLSVGTEVSAKYRGAFCEATVKVAKKQVKCKVQQLDRSPIHLVTHSLTDPHTHWSTLTDPHTHWSTHSLIHTLTDPHSLIHTLLLLFIWKQSSKCNLSSHSQQHHHHPSLFTFRGPFTMSLTTAVWPAL